MYVNAPYGISLAHNGNLTNAGDLAAGVFGAGLRHVNTNSDSEVLLNVFRARAAEYRCPPTPAQSTSSQPWKAFSAAAGGAYAAVAMINGRGIVAFRDQHGIRPLCFGVRQTPAGQEVMVASESNALDILGFELVRDVAPGEALYVTPDGKYATRRCAPPGGAHAMHLRACLPSPRRFGDGQHLGVPGALADGRKAC